MAITMTDKDGSYQEYDTYSEFEQAMILMSRIGGNKVPQDLLDEVSAKHGVKETKPFQVQIDGTKFETAISEATRELAEALDEAAKDRTPVSDECENPVEPIGKDVNGEDLNEGDYVTGSEGNEYLNTNGKVVMEVLGAGKSPLFDEANISVRIIGNSSSYTVDSTKFIKLSDNLDEAKSKFDELNGVELEDSPTEFRTGDIVMVTETFEDNYGDSLQGGDLHRFGKLNSGRVCISAVFVDGDNLDKLRLVCRKEDRKDIEL